MAVREKIFAPFGFGEDSDKVAPDGVVERTYLIQRLLKPGPEREPLEGFGWGRTRTGASARTGGEGSRESSASS